MACNYKRDYPANWKTEIRPRILAREKHCCRFCGLANHAVGYYDDAGRWCSVSRWIRGFRYYQGYRLHYIVLTIAHLDHGLQDHSDRNLAALCQRCHLHHDKKIAAPRAAASRKYGKGRADSMTFLFPEIK